MEPGLLSGVGVGVGESLMETSVEVSVKVLVAVELLVAVLEFVAVVVAVFAVGSNCFKVDSKLQAVVPSIAPNVNVAILSLFIVNPLLKE